MRKAALYARFSSNNQRDESIDAQERAIRKYAEENDIEIVEEYIDRSRTGTNTDREEFQRMLNDSRYGLFDLVIVHKLDRFARNRYDSAVSRKILRDNGVELYSVIEKFDNTPESIILEGLMETLNEYYSANLSREVMKGMRENALQCRYTGGYVPLGYRVDDTGHELPGASAGVQRERHTHADGKAVRQELAVFHSHQREVHRRLRL